VGVDHYSGINKVDDKLTTHLFKTGTLGFCAPEDPSVAVCVLPGTELSFTDDLKGLCPWPWSKGMIKHRTAIFREVNKEVLCTHHDALESRMGRSCLLTLLEEGQQATVLQLPVTHEVARATEPEKAKVS
jgi:hypothetical protein